MTNNEQLWLNKIWVSSLVVNICNAFAGPINKVLL